MNNFKEIKCEQYNVSDQEYLLVDLVVNNASFINKGDLLLNLESSKSILEVESEYSGFFYTNKNVGDYIKVGETIYIVSENELDQESFNSIINSINEKSQFESTKISDSTKTITLKAAKMLEQYQLAPSLFSEDIITENMVLNFVNKTTSNIAKLDNSISNFNLVKKIAFIGAGQGLIQALDVVYSLGNLVPTAIYDDTEEKQGSQFYNIPVVGKVDIQNIYADFKSKKFDFIIITVSTSIDFRLKIFNQLSEIGVEFTNLIHPSSNIGFNTTLGKGNIILAQTSIGACTVIGNNNFISAHCNIEHHNTLGNNCTFGPGVMTSANVNIKNNIKFGTGIFIEPWVHIDSGSMISSGSIITRNILENSVVYDSGIKIQTKHKI